MENQQEAVHRNEAMDIDGAGRGGIDDLHNQRRGEGNQDLSASILNTIFTHVNVRMLISNREKQQALAIKAAVNASEDIAPISDMMCAQFALIDGDDVQSAVNRARHLQIFRDQYKIQDTLDEGAEISRAFLKHHEGHILSIAYNNPMGNYVIIYDQANFNQSVLNTDKTGWPVFLAYGWYLYHAMSPDLHSIRQGIVLIAECEGMDWMKTDMSTMSRVWEELLVAYPVGFRELKLFHTGTIANMTFALLKKILPARIHKKYNLGCQFEGRLDAYYRIPTPEAADARVQAELESNLKKRYENERTFRLE